MSILSDEKIDEFVEDQVPQNTKIKTRTDVNIFKRWLPVALPDETRTLEDIPPVEFNKYLKSFFLTVRRKDGEDYEPDSLKSIQNSLDRYLLGKNYSTSILRGHEFETSRSVLFSKRRNLVKNGRGRKPNRVDPIAAEEERLLWQKGLMGKHNPRALQNAIWWRNNFFGLRGRDEHQKLRWGDLCIESEVSYSDDGTQNHERRYILFKERDTKTRKNPGEERSFDPKLWETPETPDICPVNLLIEFTHRRPLKMIEPDAPFYLQIHPSYADQQIWYKCQPLGEQSLGKIMKTMAETAQLPGKKRNHSGRKTTVKRLREASLDTVNIMQLTGHKCAATLNHYSSVTVKKQKEMSNLLVKAPTLSNNNPVPLLLQNKSVPVVKHPKTETVSSPPEDNVHSTLVVKESPTGKADLVNKDISNQDFLDSEFDDFNVDTVLQELENYEMQAINSDVKHTENINKPLLQPSVLPEHSMPPYSEETAPDRSLLLKTKALGLANTLFSSAKICGGTFNITIDLGRK